MESLLNILTDNQFFIALEKPADLSFHSEDGNAGFVVMAQSQFPQYSLLPIHRLDKGTSGIVLFAKDKVSARALSNCFERRQVEKYYWAISAAKPSKKQGAVRGDMEKSRNGSWKLTRNLENPAETLFNSFGMGDGLRAFLVKPTTGKTHQIRVALKSIGAPILGDSRYGGEHSDRMYLHASVLSFVLNDEKYTIQSKPNAGTYFIASKFCEIFSATDVENIKWPKSKIAKRDLE